MQQDIDRILIDRETIDRRIEELAGQITREMLEADAGSERELTLIPILTGSIIFVSDLIRRLPVRMQIRVMSITSYPGTSTASRGASIEAALTRIPESLENKDVLLIDDILDSGRTLQTAKQIISERNPAALRTCVLLRKDRPEAHAFEVDYVAFDIPDDFVVGYGLDFDDYYRNLPEIVTLKPEVVASAQSRGESTA